MINLQQQRELHADLQRDQAVMAMRPTVTRAVAAKARQSSLVEDAVSEALTQMLAAGEHLGDPEEVRERWILYAKRRLIDEQRSAEQRRRDPVPLDEHAVALTASVSGDLGRATEQDRAEWRTREQLNELDGDDRAWAEAWYDQLLSGSLAPGAQPRGLARRFGWEASRAKSVSYQARKKMVAFTRNHASGVICEQRRALLDQFIAANHSGALVDLDEKTYKQVLFHIAGCDSCRALWDSRRRTLLGRALALLPLPFGWAAEIARALREKLAGLGGALHSATYSVRQRLGLGGGASAVVAGGGAASIGGKAAAICTAVVCAAAAGGSALVTAVPGILPSAPHRTTRRVAQHAKPPAAAVAQTARVASATSPGTTTTPSLHTGAASPVKRSARSTTPTFTPGDLQPAAAQQKLPTSTGAHTASVTSPSSPPSTTPVSHAPTAGTHRQPTFTPGDLTP